MTLNFVDVADEYAKDKALKPEDVSSFMDWVNKQPHLPEINEVQAVLFLQSCYYSNEAAKTAIDTFFTVKTLCPDLFGHRNPLEVPFRDTLDVSLMVPLPKKTADGSTVFFVRVVDQAPDKYVFTEQFRYFDIMVMEHLYHEGTSNGHIILFDMKGISFGHLARLGPLTMKKILFYLQDALPVRLKGLHFLHVVPFMDKILALMKPFMKKELMDVLFLHNTVEDCTKYIPLECLPQELGGTADSMPVLHDKIRKVLHENVDLFQWEDTLTVDESKRPGKPKNVGDIFGVEGTFKKLEID